MRHKLGCSYVVVVITSSSGALPMCQTDVDDDQANQSASVHSWPPSCLSFYLYLSLSFFLLHFCLAKF